MMIQKCIKRSCSTSILVDFLLFIFVKISDTLFSGREILIEIHISMVGEASKFQCEKKPLSENLI